MQNNKKLGRQSTKRAAIHAAIPVERLETRTLMYALSGFQWPSPEISYSFMPDGTSMLGGYTSALFQSMNAAAPAPAWQREFARAFQTWAQYTPLDFRLVSDDGSAQAAAGLVQGDARFGDVRIGARPAPTNVLGVSSFPTGGSTASGDMRLNSSVTYPIGGTPDLFSLVLHEAGHTLGLDHGPAGSVMYGAYTGTRADLTADDIAGIRAMYGARQPDAYDTAGPNDQFSTATTLAPTSTGLSLAADLTSRQDVDYYRLAIPAGVGAASFAVNAAGVSLLAPAVQVYDATGRLVASQSAGGAFGTDVSVSINGLVAGQTYTVVCDGATADAFGMGAYELTVGFEPAAPEPGAPPAAPTALAAAAASDTRVDLSWQDNSADELGFVIERSTDGGQTFAPAGSVGADTTQFPVTGLAAGTTYAFRVAAVNGAGASPWSDTASATTRQPAPDPEPDPEPTPEPKPALNPDRFEVNDLLSQSADLGSFNNFAATGLTIHDAADADFYSFSPRSGGTFRIATRFANADGNLDLFVYDAAGQLLGSGTTPGDGESVQLRLQDGQRYFARVSSPEGAVNTYGLSVTKSGGAGSGSGGAAQLFDGAIRRQLKPARPLPEL